MKKVLALVLLLTLLLSLALFLCACSGGGSSSVICPSCGKKVSGLITKKDAAGVSRSWCASCWQDYRAIMG